MDVQPEQQTARRRPYRGVEAGERVRERREQLLAAGLLCFGTHGYHGVSVKRICTEAQLTERYFYESFRNRQSLFAALYQRLIEQLRFELLAAMRPEASDLGKMAQIGLSAFFDHLKRNPRIARILLIDVPSVGPDIERLAKAATASFAESLRQIMPAGMATQPLLANMPLIASGLIGATLSIAMRWIADGYHPTTDKVTETAMLLFAPTIQYLTLGATPKPSDRDTRLII